MSDGQTNPQKKYLKLVSSVNYAEAVVCASLEKCVAEEKGAKQRRMTGGRRAGMGTQTSERPVGDITRKMNCSLLLRRCRQRIRREHGFGDNCRLFGEPGDIVDAHLHSGSIDKQPVGTRFNMKVPRVLA